jgi:outer membrane protein
MRHPVILLAVLYSAIVCGTPAFGASSAQSGAQQLAAPVGPLTLKAAVEHARAHYPAIRASLAEVSAADSGIGLAHAAYLPRTDLLLQFNRATRNNVFGLILPNGVIPAISGPVLGDSTMASTFGSSAGALFSWEPFDFGLRGANVGVAESLHRRAQAAGEVTEFEVSLGVTESFLAVVAARQVVEAAKATVDRLEIFTQSIGVLVQNELRPGADESRVRAELAQARIELIRAEQARDAARVTLAEWLGLAGSGVDVESGAFQGPPPEELPAASALSNHPVAEAQSTEVDVVAARRRALEKSYRPRVFLESAAYARGTGAQVDGIHQGGAHGLAPSTGNWAVGASVKFPVFDYKENRVRRTIAEYQQQAESARYETVVQHLTAGAEKARLELENARRVAATTPVALEATRVLETQARERYRAGLGTVVEVADAFRLLRQSEIEDSLARLGVWRALFRVAAAHGDMTDLLNLTIP